MNGCFIHLHLCIQQTLLSKATYSAFRLYIFYHYVRSLGIEPTTFCAANAMLYHWATWVHLYTQEHLIVHITVKLIELWPWTPKNENSVIGSPSCHSKPVLLSFFCGTQKKIFWCLSISLSILWKSVGSNVILDSYILQISYLLWKFKLWLPRTQTVTHAETVSMEDYIIFCVCMCICVRVFIGTHHKSHRLACLPHEPRKLHTPSVHKRMFGFTQRKIYPKGFM